MFLKRHRLEPTRDLTLAEEIAFQNRRQFFLGPISRTLFAGWKSIEFGSGSLQYHPDLRCTTTRKGKTGSQLCLLGDAVDSARPERSNQDIVESFAALPDGLRALPAATSPLGGRWALFATGGAHTIVVNDAGGLRQVFYALEGPDLWCASQERLLAEQLGLAVGTQERTFLDSLYVQTNPEWWWPGDRCSYPGIRRLLPNHYLDGATRTPHRFWPVAPLVRRESEDAEVAASALLKSLCLGASRRFPLALPLTAGIDSRMILAAVKDIASELYYYTIAFPHLAKGHRDLEVPRKLLKRAGLTHHTIPCPTTMTGRFAALYRSNAQPAHELAGAYAQGLLAHYPGDRVCLVGHAGEISRCGLYYTLDRYPAAITPALLAMQAGMGDESFAITRFGEWFAGAREAERVSGVRVLDLFYWEQRVGVWAASGEAQWDIVQERFPPYACRLFHEILLGVDIRQRQDPTYALQHGIIRRLWPVLLQEPISAATPRSGVQHRVRSVYNRLRTLLSRRVRQ